MHCSQAYMIGFYGPRIVWMFLGHYGTEFWKKNLGNVECTADQMATAIEGSFLLYNMVVSKKEKRGPANLTCMHVCV